MATYNSPLLVRNPRAPYDPYSDPTGNGPDPESIYAMPPPIRTLSAAGAAAPGAIGGTGAALRTAGASVVNTAGPLMTAQQNYYGNPNQQIWNATQNQYNATAGEIAAQGNYYGAQNNALDARGGVLAATGAGLNARGGVLAAMLARRGPQQAQRQAQQGVIDAQGQETEATRGFIQQQQSHNAEIARQVAELTAAHNNVADLIAVGKQKNLNAAEDRRFNEFGLAAPQDIALPDGSAPVMATGLRGAPQTQEQVLSAKDELANKASDAQLEGARLAVSLLGTNTAAARNAAAQAGLTVDEAQQMVDDAQLTQQQADLGTSRANLDEDYANLDVSRAGNSSNWAQLGGRVADLQRQGAELAPFAGAVRYTDPESGAGTWVTPAEADRRKFEYETNLNNSHIGTNYNSQQQRDQYETQQQGPLGGYSESDIVEQMRRDPSLAGDPQFLSALVTYYRGHGLTPQAAQRKAGEMVNAVRGSSGATTTVTPPR